MVLTSRLRQETRDGVYGYLSTPAMTTCTNAGQYYFIEGTFTNEVLYCWSIIPPLTYSGYDGLPHLFNVLVSASIKSNTANNLIHVALYKNNSLQTNSIMGIYIKNTAEEYTLSLNDVMIFAPGDYIDIRVSCSEAGAEIIVEYLTTYLKRFF